jgi:hypothetical protein
MEDETHARFLWANQELRAFLRRVERLANGTGTANENDLQKAAQHLLNLAPEIGDAARGETLDAGLQLEIAEYVTNMRALQDALEKVRCVMLARRTQFETTKHRVDCPQSWVNAYHETTN